MLTRQQTQDREDTIDLVSQVASILHDKSELLMDLIADGQFQDAHDLVINLAEGLSIIHQPLDNLVAAEVSLRVSKN